MYTRLQVQLFDSFWDYSTTKIMDIQLYLYKL